jgi:hypothetical protein
LGSIADVVLDAAADTLLGLGQEVSTQAINNATFSTCKFNGTDLIHEDTTFGRGKGVLMEFVRYTQHGHVHYAVQRVGRNGDASFAVVYKLKRTATGMTTVAPAYPPLPCFGVKGEDFSKNLDCGQQFSGNSNWGLKLSGTTFSIAPVKGSTKQISDCGKSSYFGGFEQLHWQWPESIPYSFEPLPLKKLFGHAKAFLVTLLAVGKTLTSSSGSVTLTEIGSDGHADVRFIRVPNAP